MKTARHIPVTWAAAAVALNKRWPLGGDYFEMAAAGDSRFHLPWPDGRDKMFQLWTAAVGVQGRP